MVLYKCSYWRSRTTAIILYVPFQRVGVAGLRGASENSCGVRAVRHVRHTTAAAPVDIYIYI